MDNFYLIDYIKENFKIEPYILDALKYELDKHIYYYGAHFKNPKERPGLGKYFFKKYLKKAFENINFIKSVVKTYPNQNKKIISNAYFSINKELEKLNLNVFSPPWALSSNKLIPDWKTRKFIKYLDTIFGDESFIELLQNDFHSQVVNFENQLAKFYNNNNIQALLVPNDISFYENLSLKIFQDRKKPSFIFLHGLPGRYNIIDENRSDYLIVWGEKIKENYVNTGFNPNKILVSGHPYYKHLSKRELKFDLDNILVLTKSMNGAQHSDKVRLADRGNLIYYLYSIQNTLQKLNVKKVRLRLHPSENRNWYIKYIDTSFYNIDNFSLQASLEQSSLLIGPTSTVMLEAIYYGVNYLIYEPIVNNNDLLNFPLIPPFDGSDNRVPVAKSEYELRCLLKESSSIDISFFKDYIQTPFDISVVKNIICGY